MMEGRKQQESNIVDSFAKDVLHEVGLSEEASSEGIPSITAAQDAMVSVSAKVRYIHNR